MVPRVAEDANGRKIVVRTLTALDTLRLFKIAGPALSDNEAWLSMASLAYAVSEIDGIPVPVAATEAQIEIMIERLGDLGLNAVAAVLADEGTTSDLKTTVGN
jgi:hypothetical protein